MLRTEGPVNILKMDLKWRVCLANPEKYAPRYGGYCAYGVAVGKKFDIDAASWRIVDGKLYFNLNPVILEKWSADANEYIRKSEENWPQIRSKTQAELS